MKNLVEIGSLTARNGFKNEQDVIDVFNDWENSQLAQDWLCAMNYVIRDIESVHAEKIVGKYKGDIQVQVKVTIQLRSLVDCQNISIKLVSNPTGFNQVDKRWLKDYQALWNMPNDVYKVLQYFTGERSPYREDTKDKRRMFLHEMEEKERNIVLKWFDINKSLVVCDVLKGRGQFSAEWMLVTQKIGTKLKWALKPMNEVMNFYLQGGVKMSPKGSIRLGRITVQRKGGDGGRDTAKMLQFKINPVEMFEL